MHVTDKTTVLVLEGEEVDEWANGWMQGSNKDGWMDGRANS
jgi:hypothetical protein